MDFVYKVYVLPDAEGRITAINSDAFIDDLFGWVQIDEGEGDRYHHAQNNYFPLPIVDYRGIYRYKLQDGEAVERTQEEMDADYIPPEEPEPSEGDYDARIAALEKQVAAQAAEIAAYEAAYAEGVQEA